MVKIALDKQLDVMAITDHNTAGWCDGVRMAAKGTRLTVFPGVEISSHQGHILAIFDTDKSAVDIEDVLISLDILRPQFGSLEVATPKGLEETCEIIEHNGGVAIAAHIDGERGFIKTIRVGEERKRAYSSSCLRGLEIVDPALKNDYQVGTKSGYERRLACIQGSDCWSKTENTHQLDSIGDRYTLLKIDERSLAGLKLALIDPEMRVRLANDDFTFPNDAILGMWISGGFLNGQQLRFNYGVNCLIGDTGSGKSVAIELLRFGLGQSPKVDKIKTEVDRLLEQQLGNLGTVHILLKKGPTSYLVERAWGQPPGQPVIQRVSEKGLEPIEGEVDIHLFFPIKAFSQSEIIEFAREPGVRLSLTDDLIDIAKEMTAIRDVKVSLRENAAAILAEQSKEINARQELTGLPGLVEARAQIDKVLNDERIKKHQLWYKEQAVITKAESEFNELQKKLDLGSASIRLTVPQEKELETFPNQDLMQELNRFYREWQQQTDGMMKEMAIRAKSLTENVGGLKGRWGVRFTKAEEEYTQLLTTIDKDGVGLETLSKNRQRLEQEIAILEKRKEQLEREILPRVTELWEGREKLLTALQENRRVITAKRETKAKDLSQKLEDKIRLNVHARANVVEYKDSLQKISQGARLRADDLELLSKCHPITLVKEILSKEFTAVSTQTQVDETKLVRLWDAIVERKRLDDLYELQLTDVDDVIEVMLRTAADEYKAIEALAHGQKCMVVLMIALAEGGFPLIVDQPEDALHAPGIEEGIVSTLRARRGIRQCIFATRNANILVSADAEQIIAMRADAHHGEIAGVGSLDKFDHRRLVMYHVEGGEEALRRKLTIYSLGPTPFI